MSINSSVDLIKRCKGNWLSVEHYILPNIPMKINEKHGYCKICWDIEGKENNFGSRQGDVAHNFKQCESDSL